MANSLTEIPIGSIQRAQQKALLKLHLYILGETHHLLGEAARAMRADVLGAAGRDKTLDGLGLQRALHQVDRTWVETFNTWKEDFKQWQEIAAFLFLHGTGIQATGLSPRRGQEELANWSQESVANWIETFLRGWKPTYAPRKKTKAREQ